MPDNIVPIKNKNQAGNRKRKTKIFIGGILLNLYKNIGSILHKFRNKN